MPVKVRLQRIGKRDQALYRMVVADQHAKANGKVVTILGWVNPNTKPPSVKYDKKELERYLANGAQLSQAVRKLLSL